MIHFIIYEENKKWQEFIKNSILNIIASTKIKYNILVISKYTKDLKNLTGKKIYLLDIETNKLGLSLAESIRNSGDWTSQIILISTKKNFKDISFTTKILILACISKINNTQKDLQETITIALQILSKQKSFHFSYNNEFYQIPYEDILFFEKSLNDNYTSIVTKTDIYKIKQSIKNIENKLMMMPDFFKTHQSCIVNLKNIKHIDFTNNCIHFTNTNVNLISRSKKSILKEKMLQYEKM